MGDADPSESNGLPPEGVEAGGDVQTEISKQESRSGLPEENAAEEHGGGGEQDEDTEKAGKELDEEGSSPQRKGSGERGEDEEGELDEKEDAGLGEEGELEATSSFNDEAGSSSSAYLIVAAVIEELLNTVVRTAEGIEDEEGEEFSSEEEGEEMEGGEEDEEEGEGSLRGPSKESIRTVSVTTIKSFASLMSETSDRRLARLAEEEQIQREREAQQRQEKFDANVRRFNEFVKQRAELKRKNAYLTRKMYELYQLQKIEHLFKEHPGSNIEMEARYLRALTAYEEVKSSADIQTERVNLLIDVLTNKYEEAKEVVVEEMKVYTDRERELGQTLLGFGGGNFFKEVERLIRNQYIKFAEADEARVKFYILRDTVNAEESQLNALEDIGEGCTMKDYDLLRLQNQGCTEKLEEKDAELEKLRAKTLSAMTVLTEVREAAHATTEDIEGLSIVLKDVEADLAQTRERLGGEKKRRDINRFEITRSIREAGLIAEPKLLKDYKKTELERRQLMKKVTALEEKFAEQQNRMMRMRKTLSRASSFNVPSKNEDA